MKKTTALVFTQIILALNFIILGFMLSYESEYKNIIITVSVIGALASAITAVRVYRNNRKS
jgi:hypothetical protein